MFAERSQLAFHTTIKILLSLAENKYNLLKKKRNLLHDFIFNSMHLLLYFSSLKPSFTFKSKLCRHHLCVTLQTVLCYCAKPSSSGDHLENFRRPQRENHSSTKSFRLVLPNSSIYSTLVFRTAVLARLSLLPPPHLSVRGTDLDTTERQHFYYRNHYSQLADV